MLEEESVDGLWELVGLWPVEVVAVEGFVALGADWRCFTCHNVASANDLGEGATLGVDENARGPPAVPRVSLVKVGGVDEAVFSAVLWGISKRVCESGGVIMLGLC